MASPAAQDHISISKSFWKAISEKPWFAFLFVSVVFMGVAALGQVPRVGEVSDQYFRVGLMLVGIALVPFSAALAWRVPGTGQPAGPAPAPGAEAIAKIYGLAVTEPKHTAQVSSKFEVTGTLKKAMPEKQELWLIGEGEVSGVRTYWPYRRVAFTSPNLKAWAVTYETKDYADGDRRILHLFLVGQDGQALIACFRRINEEHAADRQNAKWIGIHALTSDMIPLAKPLQVTLRTQGSPA